MKMKTLYILLLLIVPFALLSCSTEGKDKTSQEIDLTGNWEISYDKNYTSNPPKDHLIELPGDWINNLDKQDMTSLVTLEKKVIISDEFKDKLLILKLGEIGVADEVFINGIKIGSTGLLPNIENKLKYKLNWLKNRSYFIPSTSTIINYGRENTIKLKIFSHIINGVKGDLKIQVYDENFSDFSTTNFFTRHIVLLNTILALILTFLLRLNKKNKTIILGSVVLISVLIAHLLVLGMPNLENGLIRYQLFVTVALIGYYFFMLTLQYFYNVYVKKINIISGILLIISITIIIYSPNSDFLYYRAGFFSHIIMGLFTLISFSVYVISMIKDFKRYWVLTPLSIYLQFSTFSTFYFLFKGQHYDMLLIYMSQIPLVLTLATLFLLYDMNLLQNRISLYAMLLFSGSKDKDLDIIESKKSLEARKKIKDLIAYLNDNYHNNYDRMTLADKFSMNEYYMGQLFKKETGKNISSYINEKRITKAETLLKDTDGKIIDIAFHVGFENTVHFHREFKKKLGITPKQFREKLGITEK